MVVVVCRVVCREEDFVVGAEELVAKVEELVGTAEGL